jgi:hypothetical protein
MQMAINNFNIFKRLGSDNPNERHIAADKLYESFKRDGGHPDEWEIRRRGHEDSGHTSAGEAASLRAAAKLRERAERKARERAELEAERQSQAREQAEAEVSRLREQLRRAKRKPTATEYVDLMSGLLKSSVLDAMGPDDISAKIEALFAERDRRDHNRAAQVDLLVGQLTSALYRCFEKQFGKPKRCSKPTVTEYLEQYADKSASWCRRCFKAYTFVTSDDWQQECWDGRGGIEGIIRSASQPRPIAKRVSKVQRRLNALSEVVRNRQWQDAEAMVSEWDDN